MNAGPSFAAAAWFWLRLGCVSFGGPAGILAMLHTELVERRRWIANDRFLHALNYCMLLPGPTAYQLAIYLGWRLHGTAGGIVAGALFVLPGALVMLALSWLYAAHGNLGWVAGILIGLKPAVLAIVTHAVWQLGGKTLRTLPLWLIALGAFAALHFFRAPFPLVILVAGVIGSLRPGPVGEMTAEPAPPARPVRTAAIWLALWWGPVLALAAWRGWDDVLTQAGVFFSKAAVVTFGGGYAVLAYVAQAAVEQFHWLSPAQMMDGLGLAETTPGPLILVTQFVGFVGAWQHPPAGMTAWVAGVLGAAVTTWVTFVPCCLWIFVSAPYIERLRGSARLTGALTAITAAVVGVILSLAVWFGAHALVTDGGCDWFVAAVATGAFVGLWRWRWGVVPVVLGSGVLGLVWHLATR